jgi:hypothetical protein
MAAPKVDYQALAKARKKFAAEFAAWVREQHPDATVIEEFTVADIPVVYCEVDGVRHHVRFLNVSGSEHKRFDKGE